MRCMFFDEYLQIPFLASVCLLNVMCLWSREHIAHVTWPENSVIASSNFFFQVPSGCWASSWAYQWEKEPTNCWGKTTVHKLNTFHNTLGGNQCHRGKGDRGGAWVVCYASAYAFRNTNLKEARSSEGTWDKGFPGCLLLGVSSGIFGRLVYWSCRLWLGFKMSEQDGTEDIAHWSIICLTWARPWLLFLDQTKRKLPHKDACDLRTTACHRSHVGGRDYTWWFTFKSGSWEV